MQTCDFPCLSFQRVVTLKNFLNSDSPIGIKLDVRRICLSLLAVLRTKDDLSFSIIQKSWRMVVIGLNVAGTVGVGKKV